MAFLSPSTVDIDEPEYIPPLRTIRAVRYNHARPEAGSRYFAPVVSLQGRLTNIIIPIYNEFREDLEDTLNSLRVCQRQVTNHPFAYCLVQDGWDLARPCLKEYFKQLFPHAIWGEIEGAKLKPGTSATYIFQAVDAAGNCAEAGYTRQNITLIIKKDNRKKHNSHEWFFSDHGFCGATQPEFAFATDCSTLFKENCLEKLIAVMLREDRCSVVTGRQVVKTQEQQHTNDGWLESMYRRAQCYDFESSFASFMGAFAIFGFLPVVPGPCGLYRWAHIRGASLEWYFDIVNRPNEDCGIILSNLKIAEDRILSYCAVLKTSEKTIMCIEPDAEFYFDAETDLSQFVKQRRRWINGTIAGYVYLFSHPKLIFSSDCHMGLMQKIAVYFLVACQLGMYGIVYISPAIFLSAFYSLLVTAFGSGIMVMPLWILYILFYGAFMLAHHKKENTFVGWMFYIQMFLSMLIVIGMVGGAIHFIVTQWDPTDPIKSLPIFLTAAVMGTPVLSSLHRPQSTFRCLISFIPFYLFLPMLVAWFGCYAVARFADLTWGNRPTGPVQEKKTAASKAEEESRAKMESQAKVLMAFVILANLTFITFYVQTSASPYFLFGVSILFCCFSAVQMVLSSLYFTLNFLMDKLIFKGVAKIIEWAYNHFKAESEFEAIQDKGKGRIGDVSQLPGFTWYILMTFWQFAVNFGYQAIFQTLPLSLEAVGQDKFAVDSIGFPLCGLISILMGYIGDKVNQRKQNNSVFKGLASIGILIFAVAASVYDLYLKSAQYDQLLTRNYLEIFGLNVFACASLVLCLLYTNEQTLLKLMLAKALMGALGNLVPSIIAAVLVNSAELTTTLNITSFSLLLLSLVLLLCAKPAPKSSGQDEEYSAFEISIQMSNQHHQSAIVLAGYFFFGFAAAPMQFTMSSYFDHTLKPGDFLYDGEEIQAYRYSLYAFMGQEGIVVLVTLATLLLNSTEKIRLFATILVSTSLVQLLFFVPDFYSNAHFGFAIAVACGLYRSFIDVFAYYFFAQCVQKDHSHIGFWVAGLNVTLILSQLLGYNLLGWVTLPHYHLLYGIAGVGCVLGIASVYRIYSPSRGSKTAPVPPPPANAVLSPMTVSFSFA